MTNKKACLVKFTRQEKQKRINLEFFQVHIDIDLDGGVDYILFNSGVFTRMYMEQLDNAAISILQKLTESFHVSAFTDNVGCVVRNKNTGDIKCTGMPPDHSTNTANTILRVCSNDIGFTDAPKSQQQINVFILTATATHLGVTEVTDNASEGFHTLEFPQTWMSAPSYDIYPGEVLDVIEIDGTGGNGIAHPLGLILVTNSYRSPLNTGAATSDSEAIILTNGQQVLPSEVTKDELVFPVADTLDGPDICAAWKETGDCPAEVEDVDGPLALDKKQLFLRQSFTTIQREKLSENLLSDGLEDDTDSRFPIELRQGDSEKCPEIEVPRPQVLHVPGSSVGIPLINTTVPTDSPLPSNNVTSASEILVITPSPTGKVVSELPTALPVFVTLAPSVSPTNSTKVPTQPPQTPAPTGVLLPATNASIPTGGLAAAVAAPSQPTLESATFFTSSCLLIPEVNALGLSVVGLSFLAIAESYL